MFAFSVPNLFLSFDYIFYESFLLIFMTCLVIKDTIFVILMENIFLFVLKLLLLICHLSAFPLQRIVKGCISG